MTQQEWFAREDKVLQFKELLNNPLLQEALDVLREHGLPVMKATPQGVDAIQHGALVNARREGYYEALKNFRFLAAVPLVKESPEMNPWQATRAVASQQTDYPYTHNL